MILAPRVVASRRSPRMCARRTILALLAVALCLAVGVSPALAARGHVFGRSFGWGVVDGKERLETCDPSAVPPVPCLKGLEGPEPGELKEPVGMAVDEASGDVYVVDQGNTRIQRFRLDSKPKSEGEWKYEFEGQFDGSGVYEVVNEKGEAEKKTGPAPPTGRFAKPEGLLGHHGIEEAISVAVDNSCSLHKPVLEGAACTAFDPSYGDVYVADVAHEVVDKFTATGEYINQLVIPESVSGGAIEGVSVDPAGGLWVATHTGNVLHYGNAVVNEPLEATPGATQPGHYNAPGFAVDAKDDLFLRSETGVVFEVGPEGCEQQTACPGGFVEVDGGPASGVAVELSTGDSYVDDIGVLKRFPAAGTPREALEQLPVPGGDGAGVAVSSASGRVYVAGVSEGRVDEFELEPPAAPRVTGESALEVTGESATLQAQVNPRSEPAEEPTSWHFQYVSEEQFAREGFAGAVSVPVPDGHLPASYEPGPVSAEVQGLAPHTTYRFRVLATNSRGGAEGELGEHGEEVARTFTTQTAGAFALPDSRVWELVSPPDKHGANLLSDTYEGAIQAAGNGDAVTYLASAPTESAPEGYSKEVQVLSARTGGSWVSRDLSAAHPEATKPYSGGGQEYRFFNEDLSTGVLQPLGAFEPSLSPRASEQTAYLRSDFVNGKPAEGLCLSASMGCYTPLVDAADETSGTPFGGEGTSNGYFGPSFGGATPDLSHIVLESQVGLTEGEGSTGGLYEWSAGQLAFVGHGLLGSAGPAGKNGIVRNAISSDGSRVVFSSVGVSHHLFLRDTATGQLLRLDVPEAACAGKTCGAGSESPDFQLASSDGSRVLFTDSQALTAGAGHYEGNSAEGGGADLYECQIEEVEGELSCRLSDLTPGGDLTGSVIGASQDASWLYFTAQGVLTSAPNSRGETARPGDCVGGGGGAGTPEGATCNLYVRHAGTTSLVAVLSARDGADVKGYKGLSGLTGRVSPDGRWLAFSSQRSLTGYDNRDAVSGQPDQEIFLYDAQAGDGNGEVYCASCDPTGARPHGQEYSRIGGLVSGERVWEPGTQWLAASVPGWDLYQSGVSSVYQPRYLSDNGRLFFNSDDALVPQDVNGTWDVYEYEPPGVGGCTTAAAAFSARSAGCVGLISSGTSAEESAFLDASATGGKDAEGHEGGGDVFFLTAESLVKKDTDTAVDVYDAHECTAGSPCPAAEAEPPPPCKEAESCRPGATPQPEIFGPPSSATFSGPGNLTPEPPAPPKPKTAEQLRIEKLTRALKTCRTKKNKHKRAVCEAKARKTYAKKASARRSSAAKKAGKR